MYILVKSPLLQRILGTGKLLSDYNGIMKDFVRDCVGRTEWSAFEVMMRDHFDQAAETVSPVNAGDDLPEPLDRKCLQKLRVLIVGGSHGTAIAAAKTLTYIEKMTSKKVVACIHVFLAFMHAIMDLH